MSKYSNQWWIAAMIAGAISMAFTIVLGIVAYLSNWII